MIVSSGYTCYTPILLMRKAKDLHYTIATHALMSYPRIMDFYELEAFVALS